MRTLMFLFFIVCFSWTISAQTVFAPAGAKWYFHGERAPTVGAGTRYCLSEVEKDTVLLATACTKIITTCYDYYQVSEPYIDTFTQDPFYTYTSGDTVFYYNDEFVRFLPLYIFNVAQGDTITYHIPTAAYASPDTLFRVIVDSITTLHISGESLKRVWTTHLDDFWFRGWYTERLGAVIGLTGHQADLPTVWSPPTLSCYADSLISYPATPVVPCDYLATHIDDISTLDHRVDVYPNPAGEILCFSLPPGKVMVKLTDINDRILEEQIIENKMVATFNVGNYTPGVYLYQVMTRDGVHSGRVLINK